MDEPARPEEVNPMLRCQLAVLLLLGGSFLPSVAHAEGEKSLDLTEVAQQIVAKTNQFRQEQGRSKVEVNTKLSEAAQYFANYLARTDKFSHTADGKQPGDRAKEHGYDYSLIAENIAYQYNPGGVTTEELAERFVEGWKESPGHRRNMLDPDVTETGVAVAQSQKTGHFYAVQMFGRPASQAVAFKVANQSEATVGYKVGDQTFSLPPGHIRVHEGGRPAAVTFQWPEGNGDGPTVRPKDGAELVVTEDPSGQFQVKRQ
jgi:uncharacterized protein YkwD